jgi:hypothetical protein
VRQVVDKFNDLLVSCYNTAGHTRLLLLHDSRATEEGIRAFFQDVHELYLKARPAAGRSPARARAADAARAPQVMLNPFHTPTTPITSPRFDALVRAAAKKHL